MAKILVMRGLCGLVASTHEHCGILVCTVCSYVAIGHWDLYSVYYCSCFPLPNAWCYLESLSLHYNSFCMKFVPQCFSFSPDSLQCILYIISTSAKILVWMGQGPIFALQSTNPVYSPVLFCQGIAYGIIFAGISDYSYNIRLHYLRALIAFVFHWIHVYWTFSDFNHANCCPYPLICHVLKKNTTAEGFLGRHPHILLSIGPWASEKIHKIPLVWTQSVWIHRVPLISHKQLTSMIKSSALLEVALCPQLIIFQISIITCIVIATKTYKRTACHSGGNFP